MKYPELFQRILKVFPDVAEGEIKTLFNTYVKLFKRSTTYGVTRKIIIDKDDISDNSYTIELIYVDKITSESGEQYGLVHVESADVTGLKVYYPNSYFFFVFDNVIYFAKSDDDCNLSAYTPIEDLIASGSFITQDIITDDTTSESEFDDVVSLAVIQRIFADMFKLNPDKINLAMFYEQQYEQAKREARKIAYSAKTTTEIVAKQGCINVD